ncbi:hypothetical protein MFLAVUS_009320 [Mucor flavus]|uniref:Uncharacterized protein n=1 Tax=Mucor flavus TaxID=439312 RepID=A0ABP9Z9L4_9FUNG
MKPTLNLATTREYWKKAIEEELKERKRDNLNDILLRKSEKLPVAKRQKRTPSIVNDLMYFDGLRDGVGAIILAKANETIITDHKNNYFKTYIAKLEVKYTSTSLAMNKIIDISDNSNDSHLDLFNSQQQQQIIDSDWKEPLYDEHLMPGSIPLLLISISTKFSTIEDDGEFLAKVIKEINETSNVNSCIKNIYLQILNSMIDYKYLYDKDEDNSEQDYIVKLYSPIIENCFHGCDIRLRWGDTIPAVCSKVGYQCRIDMRVTVSKKACVDLSVVEYAKDLSIDKYYKDKVKTVLASAIYFRNFQKNSSNVKFIPSMLIARLEGELLIYYKTDRNWFVVEKIDDVDAPQNIDDIRKGSIKSFVESLKYFKLPTCAKIGDGYLNLTNNDRLLLHIEKLLRGIFAKISTFETQQEISDAIKALELVRPSIDAPSIKMNELKPTSVSKISKISKINK